MALYLSKRVQERLRTTKASTAVDEILLDHAFELLLNVSDDTQFTSLLDRAG